MHHFVTAILVLAASSSSIALAQSVTSDQAAAEAQIRESERQWAETTVTGYESVTQRILADDFIGVGPLGNQYNKRPPPSGSGKRDIKFVSNHVNEVTVRSNGDMAIVQGSETRERKPGMPRNLLMVGRFVWTDTWLKRNGEWQIVAAEDLIAPVE
ncbi:DUF4440 domain-containing protein [Altererythrobacter salegens]|uniref:DUF4440 domain-containing protein n=1 Tax=Croceibacterium salegens TaxID=1737568 RepID=A0A6I4SSR6_9SPHN|nr:nuclear transport factor 2 family protein [Croceibacterium salegens]MXO58378.1 DUF4440 domain-containing protein [Croceibacterium salegens]